MDFRQHDDAASWQQLYHVVLACGKANDPKSFAISVLTHIKELCAYDSALVYFLDGNGKVCSQYLVNMDERWSAMYLEYYANADSQRFSCFRRIQEGPNQTTLNVRDWGHEQSTEFVPNLIQPRGLRYSCGFAFSDMQGNYRTIISLDRRQGTNFSPEEIRVLYTVLPPLNNLHKNFFYQGANLLSLRKTTWDGTSLTAREAQIANMLCQGLSSARISKALHISQSTTYKHIANIYEKMHVSSLQELLVRLLNWPK